ncbi:hypothetical protein HYALB_00006895 [Hymenoscyphus albidus]|uniref:Uncharacterized protein n=1 Tax=Hymenoscyphus albidus TaxID=595503 RepID=A0A9N9M1V9_9HELO|nr:hypothetical protein HYALB_00006895 [Hymenoscyphus albidus]
MPFPPAPRAVLAKRSLLRSVSFFPSTSSSSKPAYKASPSPSSSRTFPSASSSVRTLTTSTPLSFPRKGNEDRESMNTDSDEYTKSGTDDLSAKQEEAAFDPKATKPETERKIAGESKGDKKDEGKGNPLDVSPANREVSQQRGEQE